MRSMVPWKKGQRGALSASKSDPFAVLQKEVDELFDQFSNTFFDTVPWRGARTESGLPAFREPNIDFTETDEAYELSADLPGVEEKDLDLAIDENMLTIKAEQNREEERKEKNYHVMERTSGSYQRSFPLPSDIDHEKIKAKFKNGLLSVSLPKNPESASEKRKIEIES